MEFLPESLYICKLTNEMVQWDQTFTYKSNLSTVKFNIFYIVFLIQGLMVVCTSYKYIFQFLSLLFVY